MAALIEKLNEVRSARIEAIRYDRVRAALVLPEVEHTIEHQLKAIGADQC